MAEMKVPLNVLIVEDSEDDAALLVRELERGGYDVTYERVDTPVGMNSATNSEQWDMIICDYSMPHFSGMDALRLQRSKNSDIPFIFLSGTIGEETAVAALKEGAQDYLMKSNLKRLIPAIQRELHEAEQRKERKRLEQEVQNLQKFEAIGRLAGGIAHDFNNALGVILGWAQLGFAEAEEGTPAREKFRTIRDQAERTARLTSQLLAFARHQVLHRRNVNLNDVVTETLELLRSVIEQQVEFVTSLEAVIPLTHADPAQLEQVLLNLFLNARDAMPHGGRIVVKTESVHVTAEEAWRLHVTAQSGRYVLLSVSDTGMGMDTSTLEHLFEPFFTTKALGRGTGLGLATVHGIIQQHAGFVNVRSVLGEGSTFRVYLPAGELIPETSDDSADEQPVQGGSETLLLAEDHDLLRSLTYVALAGQGYNVILAKDGHEAIGLFEQNSARIRLVILDFMMPRTSGAEALARMRMLRPNLPAILTTGYVMPNAGLDPKLANGTVLLEKPYRPETLNQMVRQSLDRANVQ